MNNAWPIASRLSTPCSSLRPLTSTRSWPISLIRTARRNFTAPHRAYSSTISCTKQSSPRLLKPRSLTYRSPKAFSTTQALAHDPRKGQSPATPPPPSTPNSGHVSQRHVETDPELEHDSPIYYPSSLPAGPLPADTIRDLFPTLSHTNGNRVLSILHKRRFSGSLADRGIAGIDEALGIDLSDVSPMQMMKALEYLRASFPVDEEEAAVEWAEAEAARIEREVLSDRGVRLGLLKKVEPDPDIQDDRAKGEEWEGIVYDTVTSGEIQEVGVQFGGQGTDYGREKYGRSVFDTVRKSNEANWEAEKAEKERLKLEEEAKMIAEGEQMGPKDMVPKTTFLGVEITETREKSAYIKKYEEMAQLKFNSLEDMEQRLTRFQRLWPSTLFTIVICTLCALFATGYEPPDNTVRLFPEITPALATCSVLLGLNLMFWLAWRIPRFWPFLNRYMVSTPGYPMALASLGNVFSHQELGHLLINMTWLMTFGVWCHDLVGRGVFLGTYLAAGTVGSLASLSYFVLARNFGSASVGASGAVNGIFALLLVATNRNHIRVPYTEWDVSMSPKLVLAAFLVLEVYNLRTGRVKNIDHWGHLGGAAVGIAVGTAWRWRDLVEWWNGWIEDAKGKEDVMKQVERNTGTEGSEEDRS